MVNAPILVFVHAATEEEAIEIAKSLREQGGLEMSRRHVENVDVTAEPATPEQVAGLMTPDELHRCLTALRWPLRTLGEAASMSDRTLRRIAAGTAPMPAPLAAWLRRRAEAMLTDPPPPGARDGPGGSIRE